MINTNQPIYGLLIGVILTLSTPNNTSQQLIYGLLIGIILTFVQNNFTRDDKY
ncbi:hypothetical protein C1645_780699 [Glomus cerebriforme]|uniref:Uncharacterized protein n=1 Tax=Glomus cerebriforme TaxID=658196 RepID=A0A397SK24_9GLOM|nr:hypothetical protein C1645_780699 [Glomus cerebriforme]